MGAEREQKGGVVNEQQKAAITKSFPQPSLCGYSRYYLRVGGWDCKVVNVDCKCAAYIGIGGMRIENEPRH